MASDGQLAHFIGPLLDLLAAPLSADNRNGIRYWAASEGVADRHHNPLATSYNGFGGKSFNADAVKTYPTIGDGVKASAATIRLPDYRAVLAALRQDQGLPALYDAVNQSPWCKGCSDGHYPKVLYAVVHADLATAAGNPPTPRQEATDESWGRTITATAKAMSRNGDRIEQALRGTRTLTY